MCDTLPQIALLRDTTVNQCEVCSDCNATRPLQSSIVRVEARRTPTNVNATFIINAQSSRQGFV